MEKVRRSRRGESAWREIVDRQARSGLSVAAFCEQETLGTASFYLWRSRLLQAAQIAPRVAAPDIPAQSPTPSGSGFIDLGALGTSGPRFEIRLELGGGVLLHLVRG